MLHKNLADITTIYDMFLMFLMKVLFYFLSHNSRPVDLRISFSVNFDTVINK